MLDASVVSWQAASTAAALLCAFAVSLGLVLTKKHHGHLTLDSTIGVQKFHAEPTPRVGGIGIYLGLVLAWMLVRDRGVREILGVILAAGFVPLVCGLAEDLTKKVGVLPRLIATMLGGVVAWAISGVALNRLDVYGLDWLMTLTPVAVIFTAFAVGGVANAINIIDGFHGLASGTTIIALLALGSIAAQADDPQLAIACFMLAAAIGGFWLVNYPWGKLFMGDGGAYFSGFALAWLAVLLPVRNPEVSVWASLLVCAYPVIEVIYSMVRRYAKRQSPGEADSGHLHSLIKVNLVRPRLSAKGVDKSVRNAAVSPIVWAFTSVPAVLATVLFYQPALLGMALVGCALLYHIWYQHLAQKRLTPEISRKVELPQYPIRRRVKHARHRPRERRVQRGVS
ncbi:glycosyltransferase [Ramlibacter sp.]|uniref:MraY family glycosyltransferase n=1 Tax=Ramlibacter sp. TaxID=1917967 RepID=UPI002C2DB951|nr:glycosyltransferase [Ramlibacter sp.]HWI83111.1 glycosyltransferase [Ramlibacter sp.]